jgi:hypothetical protein
MACGCGLADRLAGLSGRQSSGWSDADGAGRSYLQVVSDTVISRDVLTVSVTTSADV